MRWVKIPLDEETYDALRLLAEATDASVEELAAKIVAGSVRGYARLVAEGRAEEIKKMFLSPVVKTAIEEALKMEYPPEEPGKLWLP